MWARVTKSRIVRSRAFCFSLLYGLAGILVDIDHPIGYFTGWDAPYYRWLHTPLLIISSFILGCCLSYLGGLFLKMVLNRGRR